MRSPWLASRRLPQFFGPFLLLTFALVSPSTLRGKDPKLTVEELVAKHLASLGSDAARASLRSRTAEGTAEMKILLGGSATAFGQASLKSLGHSNLIALTFTHPDYAGELMLTDGNDFQVNRANPSSRSGLGAFVFRYNHILKEGLLGGVLSTAWPLLDAGAMSPHLRYAGLQKFKGAELHKLEYASSRASGDVKIALYFEPETFRHVASVYQLVIHAQLGPTSLDSVRQTETKLTLEERFSDFKTFDSLSLPTHWTIQFTTERTATTLWEWAITLDKIRNNAQVDPSAFVPVAQ